MDNSELLRGLHDFSGLTWEELGRLFGVSRNAIFSWASGGMMNTLHAQFLIELSKKIRLLPATTTDERRNLLFTSGNRKLSMFEEILYEQMEKRGPAINGSPFTPDQLLGALHDSD